MQYQMDTEVEETLDRPRECMFGYFDNSSFLTVASVLSHLQKLFIDMSTSTALSVMPERRIAELTFLNSETAFGNQQDMNECLDAFLDLLCRAFKKEALDVLQM